MVKKSKIPIWLMIIGIAILIFYFVGLPPSGIPGVDYGTVNEQGQCVSSGKNPLAICCGVEDKTTGAVRFKSCGEVKTEDTYAIVGYEGDNYLADVLLFSVTPENQGTIPLDIFINTTEATVDTLAGGCLASPSTNCDSEGLPEINDAWHDTAFANIHNTTHSVGAGLTGTPWSMYAGNPIRLSTSESAYWDANSNGIYDAGDVLYGIFTMPEGNYNTTIRGVGEYTTVEGKQQLLTEIESKFKITYAGFSLIVTKQ